MIDSPEIDILNALNDRVITGIIPQMQKTHKLWIDGTQNENHQKRIKMN